MSTFKFQYRNLRSDRTKGPWQNIGQEYVEHSEILSIFYRELTENWKVHGKPSRVKLTTKFDSGTEGIEYRVKVKNTKI